MKSDRLITCLLNGVSIHEIFEHVTGNSESLSEGIITKYTNKSWLKSAANKDNYEGPNGNQIIAYVWPWKWDVREIGDEVKDVRVSDWDRAELCTTCNRKIVHIFFVLHKDDKSIAPYGFDHVHTALGIEKELSQSFITKIKNSVTIPKDQKPLNAVDEKRIKSVLSAFQKMSANTITDAMEKMSRITGFRQNISLPVFYHTGEKKYVFLVGKQMTDATLKKVSKLIPEFERVSKEKVYSEYAKERIEKQIKYYARGTVKDAVDFATRLKKDQRNENPMWAASIKDKLIMIIPKYSPIVYPTTEPGVTGTFAKHFPGWEVGNEELAKKFRDQVEDKK